MHAIGELDTVVELVGTAGVGKSRLLDAAWNAAEGLTIYQGACTPYGAAVPYSVYRPLMRSGSDIPIDASAELAGNRLTDIVAESRARPGPDAPAARSAVRRPGRLDPRGGRDRSGVPATEDPRGRSSTSSMPRSAGRSCSWSRTPTGSTTHPATSPTTSFEQARAVRGRASSPGVPRARGRFPTPTMSSACTSSRSTTKRSASSQST